MSRPSVPIRRLQALDRRVGPAVCAALAPPRLARRAWRRWRARRDAQRGVVRPVRPARRVLAIKFWGLGSLQLLTPAARALRARHPGAHLTLLTLAPNRELVEALGVFDEVRVLDVHSAGVARLAARLLAVAAGLRRQHFDAIYDFEFLTRTSAIVGALAAPRRLVGFSSPRAFRGGLHDETHAFDETRHVALSFRDLAAGEALGPLEVAPTPARLRAADRAAVAGFLAERLGAAGRRLVVLNPNAGELAPERRWSPERFGALGRRLELEHDVDVVIVGTPDEADVAAEVVRAAGPRALDLAGGLSLGELLALLELADLVVSNDSGPMHLAAALGTATVGLFGPETPRLYAPLGPRVRALHDAPPCSPCINVHDNKLASCVLGRAECMERLSVDAVLAAALALAPEIAGRAAPGGTPSGSRPGVGALGLEGEAP